MQFLKESWETIAVIFTGVSGFIGVYVKWKRDQNKSAAMLYQELERLKKLIIEKVPKDIQNAQTIAEQNSLLEQLKEHCPECYEKIKKLNNVQY
jgi:hypothetical protein